MFFFSVKQDDEFYVGSFDSFLVFDGYVFAFFYVIYANKVDGQLVVDKSKKGTVTSRLHKHNIIVHIFLGKYKQFFFCAFWIAFLYEIRRKYFSMRQKIYKILAGKI